MTTAYCMRCRAVREISNPVSIVHKNKRPAIKGECCACGTTVYRMAKYPSITGRKEDWREEWQGMPEFVQEAQQPYAQIIFRFGSKGDLQSFARLIGQRLTKHTKSAWHPALERGKNACKRWIDES